MQVNAFKLPHGEDELAVKVYTDDGGGSFPAPVIVLCHGFCGIQSLLLPTVAHQFTQAGYVVVTFDYRGFGDSSGERGRLVPMRQLEDIQAVIHWVCQEQMLDAQRIGLWGTSLGGAHVVVAAAREPLVKCVVSQLGFACGEMLLTGHLGKDEKVNFIHALQQMRQRRKVLGKEVWVSASKILKDVESKEFFEAHRGAYPQIAEKIPLLTMQEMLNYRPVEMAARVRQPTLVMAAECDAVNPPAQAQQLFDALGGEKAFHLLPGACHYDVYKGDHFKSAMILQLAWFQQHL